MNRRVMVVLETLQYSNFYIFCFIFYFIFHHPFYSFNDNNKLSVHTYIKKIKLN